MPKWNGINYIMHIFILSFDLIEIEKGRETEKERERNASTIIGFGDTV